MEARLTGIDRAEMLRYLRYGGGVIPEETEEALRQGEERLLRAARPRAVWRAFGYRPDEALEGTDFRLEGDDIRAFLADCDQVILLAATLGAEPDLLQKQLRLRDMSAAVILDAAGSAAIENVCDNLCADLAAAFAPRHLTERFSPGYGDMPLSQQSGFFRLLDISRRLGVSLTDSDLMVPQKTVTAVVGVSDRPQPRRNPGCESCAMAESCAFRREGKTCGK